MAEIPVNNPVEQTDENLPNTINPQTQSADGSRATAPPGTQMPLGLQLVLAAYVLAMFVGILYLLIKLWPLVMTGDAEQTEFFGTNVTIALDIRLIMIAALGGALGAYVHLATSFADFSGNQQLKTSWAWWYVFRPFIGMALAEVVYLALRGGLLNAGGTATTAISPYGVAAITALTGLFSKQATDKLREVFETLFRTQQKVERNDALPHASPPSTGGATDESKGQAAAAAGAK